MRERPLGTVLLLALVLPAQELPTTTCRLEGMVVDPHRQPVPGARVVAEALGTVVGNTWADGSGRFVFARVPATRVTLRATSDAPASGGVWLDLLGLGRTFATVPVAPARTVTGTVRDQAGQPLVGAFVVACRLDVPDLADATTTTDTTGRFTLAHAPLGALRVLAWAAGHGASSRELAADDAAFDAELEAESGLQVRCHALGATPERLAGSFMHVQAFHRGTLVPLPPALARLAWAEDGTATVAGWNYDDDLQLHCITAGAAAPLLANLPAGRGSTNLRFAFDGDAPTLRGRILDLDGVPCGGRTVLVQNVPEEAGVLRLRSLTTTSADGTFCAALPVDRGERYALRLLDGDLVPTSPRRSGWFLGTFDSTEPQVVVQPATTLRARFVDYTGVPVSGATVLVVELRNAAAEPASPLPRAHGAVLATLHTDGDGRFVAAGLDLEPGREVGLLVAGHHQVGATTVKVPEGRSADAGTVALPDGGSLHVRRDDVEEAELGVLSVCADTDLPWPIPACRVDRDGSATFTGLWPGTYSVLVTLQNAQVRTQLVEVAAGRAEVHLGF